MKALIAVLLLALILAACTQTAPATNTQDTQTPSAPAQQTQPAAPTQPATAEPTVNKQDPAVLKLFERSGQVKSYSFDLAKLPEQSGSHTYYVKGDKVRIDPLYGNTRAAGSPDVIFLDLTQKTAVGYCLRGSTCNKNDPIPVNYDTWAITLPPQWINQVKYGQKFGTLEYNNRPVTVVRYQADKKYYEAYVDNYWGFPVRIAIATDADMKNIVGGTEYKSIAFNNVEDSFVVHQTATI